MAVRIYSLAKELKIDSKELVEMLPKAGISGKGSALASLTDEEAAKFHEYLAKRSARPAAAVERPVERPLERMGKPAELPKERVIKDLTRPKPPPLGRKKESPVAAPAPEGEADDGGEPSSSVPLPAVSEPPVREQPQPTIAAEVPAPLSSDRASDRGGSAGTGRPTDVATPSRSSPLGGRVGLRHQEKEPTAPSARPSLLGKGGKRVSTTSSFTTAGSGGNAPLSRADYIPPGGVMRGKPGVMPTKPKEEGDRTAAERELRRKGNEPSRPQIRVAPLKFAPQPTAKKTGKNEPAPQKPDMRLPVDVIRSSKAGGAKPLEQHIKRTEAKGTEVPKARGRGPTEFVDGAARPGDKKRGKVPGAADNLSMGGREARQLSRKRTGTGTGRKSDEEEGSPVSRFRQMQRTKIKRTGSGSTAAPRKSKIVLDLPCSVRSFSEAVGISAAQVLRKLLEMGNMMSITGTLDEETAELLAVELGVELDLRKEADIEEEIVSQAAEPDEESTLLTRPPVITFLGHVDHGKTSLLDRIIGIDVAKGESGGITQHIRAYQIERDGRKISFVDTPGHEAFTEMRARGANVTDIAVLVVAADDGVMPQTEEAISHARAANVPIVVALNKIDLPGVDEQKIFSQLATAGLLPTEWGGEVEVVRTSATTGKGIDDLIETLFTIAELHDLKANPERLATGTCLEAEVHGARGVIAKFIVQRGTLRVGDAVVCGSANGFIKAMYNTLKPKQRVEEAGPSTPVNITGLDSAPSAGQHFYAVEDISVAREIASKHVDRNREISIGGRGPAHVTLENMLERMGQEQAKNLNIILRADTRGSIEAILKELTKLDHPEVKIKVLQATVGGISEADIHLADASDAVVIGFNVVPDEKARSLAEQRGVQVRRYDIIYKITTDLKAGLEGLLKPEEREMELGRALVQRTFTISRMGTIAGCRVLSGIIQRNARIRIIRESRVIGDYGLDSLKREKDDAREVREGLECGIKLAGFNDIKEGDVLEAYRIEEVARTL